MSALIHLIAGPPEHGVSEYARLLHHHSGGVFFPVDKHTTPEELPPGPLQVTFTDHLFGPDPDAAVERVLDLSRGRRLSVSFHDIPQEAEGAARFARRTSAYQRLTAAADLVVANSRHEAEFFRTGEGTLPANLEIIPLPLPEAPELGNRTPDEETVGIIGFLYPGKGHSDIVTALTGTGFKIRALGRPSEGHEDLVADLSTQAEELGVGFTVSGYLAEQELWEQMSRIRVPVCAHRHISASGSLMRWLAAGRKVLVSDGRYPRELAEGWPEQIRLVSPGRWGEEIQRAMAEPDFAETVHTGTTWYWPEVTRAWQAAWASHLSPALVDNDHRTLNPGTAPGVSVIIPYYNDPANLQAVLDGVSRQDFPGHIEVIIADDGSTIAPEPHCSHPLKVVRQADLGFRAAAARNLGAAHATQEILAFLDGDTVPEAGYLRAATSWVAADPRCVVVGRRLHQGREAEWLHQAWVETENLERSDERSWRFIISAVLTCSRELFESSGGFEAEMVGYGGEDWEFGWRLWQQGAIFRHEPAARAHHEDPDWGARITDPVAAITEKNLESMALAPRITHPMARPGATIFDVPDLCVLIPGDVGEVAPGVWEACLSSWLGVVDVQILSNGEVPELFRQDPRVRVEVGGFSAAVRSGARIILELQAPLLRPEGWGELVVRLCALGGYAHLRVGEQQVATFSSTRARALGIDLVGSGAWRVPLPEKLLLEAPLRLEARFAGWEA